MGLLHGGLESREINLTQSAFVNDAVDGRPVGFLIVARVVFRFGDDSLALDSVDLPDGDLPNQVGIFSKSLERAAVLRHTRDVDVRPFDKAIYQILRLG